MAVLKVFQMALQDEKHVRITCSNGKIMNAVSEVTVANQWIQQTGRARATPTKSGQQVRFIIEGTYQGVKIKVVTTATDIITAHPIR